MKPHWKELPESMLSDMLWDIESLDYDGYESSKAEKIHEICCGLIDDRNERIIDAYWQATSEEKFQEMVVREIESHQCIINRLTDLKNGVQ
jgi:hypothetical protein